MPLAERPLEAPIDANRFVLASSGQTVVGTPQIVFSSAGDTFADFARTYGLGYDELLAANPGVDPWQPGEKTPILLPTQFVLPDAPHTGIVLNIAAKRLFYYPHMPEGQPQVVLTYPIGIGRVGWETPVGVTRVVSKARDPSWYVPASVRAEHAELGDPLPAVVPPGPDNPLGTRVLQLEMPGYLIHGTNKPFGVGMRVSHGCIRLYPENIETLYELVDIGESVAIVNEPYLLGWLDGDWYFESHVPLADDAEDPGERLAQVLDKPRDGALRPLDRHEKDEARTVASVDNGVPLRLAAHDIDEVYGRARPVKNVVKTDPDAPSLTEVREMIDEAVRESKAEPEAL